MTMHKVLHPRYDVNRLYVSRKEEGGGLVIIEESVHASTQQLEDYTEKRGEGLITATNNDTDNTTTNRKTITRKQKWEEKQLSGYFKRLTNNISNGISRTWLRKGNLKRETESLQIAVVQEI